MGLPTGGFADVDTGFEPLPAGIYTAEVAKGEVKEAGENAKNPGSQYIAWEFTITDEEYTNRKAWLNTSLVPKAKPLLKQFLIGVGYTDEELNDDGFEIEVEEIVGRACRLALSVGTNPRTQEPNNSVRRVLPFEEGDGAELPS